MNSQLRARIIAEWRGLPERPPSKDRAELLSGPLSKVMKALGLSERLHEEDVKQAWQEMVGDFLATHSAPVSMRDGVLLVRVLQPTLLYELDRVWKPQLVQKLRARFGQRAVRDIRFRIG